MQIWLITDGEKEGPFLDFEIRSRIHSGELTKEQKIWHSDLDGWTPLGEVGLFVNEFRPQSVDATNIGDYLEELEKEQEVNKATQASPRGRGLPALPSQLYLWQRFGARWFDYLLYMTLLLVVVVSTKSDFFALSYSPWFPFVSFLPWIFLESISLSFWGTTPGKWLVGLKVRNAEAAKLTPWQAIIRSIRVMILGMGFGQSVFIVLCHGISAWLGFKKKIVLWDSAVGTRVSLDRPQVEKWLGFGIGLATLFFAISLLFFQALMSVDLESLSSEQQAQFRQAFPFLEEVEKGEN